MTKEIKELFSVGASIGYEWDEFHVYRHPLNSRKYVVYVDNGCSCNYYETPSLAHLEAETPLGKREVYAKFSEWWPGANYCSGTKIDNLERLRASL